MRGRIGNPKQKLRRDKKKKLYTSGHYNENNKNYLLEKKQHKQLSRQSTLWRDKEKQLKQLKQLKPTTIAPKTTHWALRGLLKTMVVNRVVNFCQFGGIF